MNRDKVYYSRRLGKLKDSPDLSLKMIKRLFLSIYSQLSEQGYFQKYFGYSCVDDGNTSGELGRDIDSTIFLALRKDTLWPIYTYIEAYNEDDLFDIIEYLHDHCSKPLEGHYHSYADCGMHYHTFEDKQGQEEFRKKVNNILSDYAGGFELTSNGEILFVGDSNLAHLFNADIPSTDEANIKQKVDNAVNRFRRHKATLEERRFAIRELSDVLEYLRPKIKTTLMINDERDIFNIANNFGIRHHNLQQKDTYDKAIWYSWIFYYYLATIHASLRLIAKQEGS